MQNKPQMFEILLRKSVQGDDDDTQPLKPSSRLSVVTIR